MPIIPEKKAEWETLKRGVLPETLRDDQRLMYRLFFSYVPQDVVKTIFASFEEITKQAEKDLISQSFDQVVMKAIVSFDEKILIQKNGLSEHSLETENDWLFVRRFAPMFFISNTINYWTESRGRDDELARAIENIHDILKKIVAESPDISTEKAVKKFDAPGNDLSPN